MPDVRTPTDLERVLRWAKSNGPAIIYNAASRLLDTTTHGHAPGCDWHTTNGCYCTCASTAETEQLRAELKRICRAMVETYGEDYGGEGVAAEVERLLGHLVEYENDTRRITAAKSEALVRALAERDALKAAIAGLHTPITHGGITICAHCSGWTGTRARGEIRPHPCPTVAALDAPHAPADAPTPVPEGTEKPTEAPTPVPAGVEPHDAPSDAQERSQ